MFSKSGRFERIFPVVSGWALSICAAVAAPLSFFTDEVECRLGESVMIPFRAASKAGETIQMDLHLDKPGVIEILRQPEILPGQETGFARIRTLVPGVVTLKSGDSKLRVKVANERPLSLLRKMRPHFTSPAEGACAWGVVAIGAEIWVGAPGVDRMAKPEAFLHLPDGKKLAPDEAFPPIDGPFWRLVFHLDTAKLPPGDCNLTVSCKPPVEGGKGIETLMSDPHPLTILAAPGEDDVVFSDECENLLDTPRNERMGMEPPGVVMDSAASGYRAVALRRGRPAWMIQPEIETPGRYQWIVRARGALAGAAYPSLGIIQGENARDSGAVRLVTSTWHNVPVGRPVRLDKGPQWIGITLANEFNYRNTTMRFAEIDRFELRRVPDVASGSGGGMMMMAGDAMMMQGGDAKAGEAKNKAPVARGLKVAFSTLCDCEEINGRLEIRATLHSPALKNDRDYQAIRTDLWINDERLASASGRHPVFTVHPHDLKKGKNRIEAHAVSPCGNHAMSPGQTLLANSPVHPENELVAGHDAAPPTLVVLYPKPGGVMSSTGDALVLSAFDDLKLSHFEVRIDDAKTPLDFPATQDTGPMLIHLPASLLSKGKRKIEVSAIDSTGKQTRSPAIQVEVRDPSGPVLMQAYPRAMRLAATLGYGPDTRTLVNILTTGENAWLDEQIDTPWGGAHDQLIDALAGVWFPELSDYHIRGRVITELLATRHPARARFALFVQNHFSTWITKTGSSAKWEEHRNFRDAGIARFQDLLLASATSPAMMVYLDQQNSFGRQLNENYAREVMELHTVGVHAGYQQSDVTSLAHLLTGWGAQREAAMDGSRVDYNYRFSPYLNDGQALEIFGLSVPAAQSPETADDRIRMVIEMLAARPQTARFIAEKMAAHYLGMPVDEATVEILAEEFLRSGGDMRRMMRVLASSPRFMAADSEGKLMTPVEFGVAHQRAAGSLHPWPVIGLGARSGRNLFDRASPDGYPEANEEYADSNYQLQKWSYCKELEQAFSATLPHGWFDAELLEDPHHRDALIDHAFTARKGREPSVSTREALHAILQHDIADQTQRRRLFASFLHMMPEYQTR